MISVCLESSEANSGEKTFAKSEYLIKIEVRASFAINAAIFALQKRWTSLSWLGLLKEATYTTKVSYSRLKAIATNFFFPNSSTRLVVGRAFSIV